MGNRGWMKVVALAMTGFLTFALLKLRPTGGFIEEWENDGEQFG